MQFLENMAYSYVGNPPSPPRRRVDDIPWNTEQDAKRR